MTREVLFNMGDEQTQSMKYEASSYTTDEMQKKKDFEHKVDVE